MIVNVLKSIIFSILSIVLLTSMVVPMSYSQEQTANQTNVSSNLTSTISETNVGQQVSDFVHNATALFKQQREETLSAIKDCHEKIRNATSDERSQVADECKTTLKTITEKYQDARKQFQQLFKQFRENILVLRNEAQGMHVSPQEKEMALKNIDKEAVKSGFTGLSQKHMKGMGENETKGVDKASKHMNENNATSNEPSQHGKR